MLRSFTSLLAVLLIVHMWCSSLAAPETRAQNYLNRRMEALRELDSLRGQLDREMTKRVPHQIEARALNQFKNCYFSPIQCVLMERRRK